MLSYNRRRIKIHPLARICAGLVAFVFGVLTPMRQNLAHASGLAESCMKLFVDQSQTTGVPQKLALNGLLQVLVNQDTMRPIDFGRHGIDILKKYFGEWSPNSGDLPNLVSDWLYLQLENRRAGRPITSLIQTIQIEDLGNAESAKTEKTLVLILREMNPQQLMIIAYPDHQEMATKIKADFGLTPTEAEVLYWVYTGKTNPEIGFILGSSPKTVTKHLENIFVKMSIETRAMAIVKIKMLLENKSIFESEEQIRNQLATFFQLSPREAEVAFWIIVGKSGPEIAEILSISLGTVSKHTELLLRKMNINNKNEIESKLRSKTQPN